MTVYLVDINATEGDRHFCYVHSYGGSDGNAVRVDRACVLPAGSISVPPTGDRPFDCMDGVYVTLTPDAEAIVAAALHKDNYER